MNRDVWVVGYDGELAVARRGMAAALGVSETQAQAVLDAAPHRLVKDIAPERADATMSALKRVGVKVELLPTGTPRPVGLPPLELSQPETPIHPSFDEGLELGPLEDGPDTLELGPLSPTPQAFGAGVELDSEWAGGAPDEAGELAGLPALQIDEAAVGQRHALRRSIADEEGGKGGSAAAPHVTLLAMPQPRDRWTIERRLADWIDRRSQSAVVGIMVLTILGMFGLGLGLTFGIPMLLAFDLMSELSREDELPSTMPGGVPSYPGGTPYPGGNPGGTPHPGATPGGSPLGGGGGTYDGSSRGGLGAPGRGGLSPRYTPPPSYDGPAPRRLRRPIPRRPGFGDPRGGIGESQRFPRSP